ncbi:prepilin-type N-terminal cleavage/methylation domain-containing protein [Dactylosporangium sp. CS-033363]|uniref:prepilin-type N-terminal cleavage/methylation domain-containing protein n=1 Tax=Dactylosporangium sp. CS-033363 TaxID=3239935 RepID=UPI003D9139B1
MTKTLRRMQEKRAAGDGGFTLVELLVVVVIIGVLVAIAVPMYLNYRKGAANKSAESDVRAAVSAVEQFYTENNNKYPFSGSSTADKLVFGLTESSASVTGDGTQTATLSPGNSMQYKNNGASYRICGMNSDGKTIYVYDSSVGGSVKKAAAQADLAACIASATP